ncbi:hypothetical protein M9Y10_033719 [Tritrichomonas musculus]|uniref:Uncharacterized protein n=1 Tax=Tritrichomonas musculus TaxID=1915356 RepID=A0ABR2KDQ3_9EUKA
MHYIGNSTPKTAYKFAVRQSMARDFENDLEISFDINKKENIGGAHLNFRDSNGTEFDTNSIENIENI